MKLTRKQIETMEAGPEMNAAVAELMGWPIVYMGNPNSDEWWTRVPSYPCLIVHQDGSNWGVRSDSPEDPMDSFDPSTDIAAAWDAAEKSKIFHSYDNGGCEYVLSKRGSLWVIADLGNDMEIITFDESPKVAICRAVLLWDL